jgi:hypothetical protein
VTNIASEDQVRFQPSDQEWRTVVSNLGVRNALNVYLFEMREKRKLRTNERMREIESGVVTDTRAPRRVDCHYLITAWSRGWMGRAWRSPFHKYHMRGELRYPRYPLGRVQIVPIHTV